MAGPTGYIFHRSSGKIVHPDDTVYLHSKKSNPGQLKVRFVPVEGFGHFGYIEHLASGKIVHPYGGSLDPGNNTVLKLHSDRHAGALFGFDEDDERIMHRGGKIWHPMGGSPNPSDGTDCVLHSDVHDAAKFYFGDLDGKEMSPYPAPELSGSWKVVKAFINPLAQHTYTQTYKVGKSMSTSVTEQHAWNVSAGAAFKFFSGSAEYSGMVEKTSESTWSTESEESTTITVEAGKTVVMWQYVFGMMQYDEGLAFQSNILGDSNSLDVEPEI